MEEETRTDLNNLAALIINHKASKEDWLKFSKLYVDFVENNQISDNSNYLDIDKDIDVIANKP